MNLGPDVEHALRGFRAEAESLMLDTSVITRGGPATWDDATGTWTDGDAERVYSGPCKVQTRDVQVASQDVAGRPGFVVDWTVHLPIDRSGAVREGDTVTITASRLDAELVGKSFTVNGPHVGSFKTARRLPVRAEVSEWT